MPGDGGLIIYRVCRALVRFLLLFVWRWEVRGLKNFPAKGPVIVVANHISYWDPVIIAVALPRQVFFMGKRELFGIPVLGPLLRGLGVFPVDRARPDRNAFKRALELLKQGQVIGIFPEGRRSKSGALLPPSTGAAYFAIKTGTPVCPAALIEVAGKTSWGLFRRLTLQIGPSIEYGSGGRQDLDAVALQMMQKIQELIDLKPEQQESCILRRKSYN